MGTFRISIQLAAVSGVRFESMEALVDTDASYTWIPRDLLEVLGVQPDETRVFVLADGREVGYPMAWVRVRLDERTQPTLVICGDPGTEPLLGAFTLEGFGLGVDPVNRRLIQVPGLLKKQIRPIGPPAPAARMFASKFSAHMWSLCASMCRRCGSWCADRLYRSRQLGDIPRESAS
ncbi:MAG TPA: aspartyl protease family protein [Gemmatimonadales bacterium]|nr:aspartyl protease family protein [Gemmatimonadales bacterium]